MSIRFAWLATAKENYYYHIENCNMQCWGDLEQVLILYVYIYIQRVIIEKFNLFGMKANKCWKYISLSHSFVDTKIEQIKSSSLCRKKKRRKRACGGIHTIVHCRLEGNQYSSCLKMIIDGWNFSIIIFCSLCVKYHFQCKASVYEVDKNAIL